MNSDERRRIVEILVRRITVAKDEIEINLCYLPSFREMTNRQRMVKGSASSELALSYFTALRPRDNAFGEVI
jgi:hypothetical protein